MKRLWPLLLVTAVTGCGGKAGGPVPAASGDAARGERLIEHYGCGGCHTIPGIERGDARVGPSLADTADKRFIAGRLPNTPEELARWIRSPQGVSPGTLMPDLGVRPDEAGHRRLPLPAHMSRVALLLVLAAVVTTPAGAASSDLGRQLYVQGCVSCHGKDARGVSRYGPARGVGEVRGAGPSLVGVGAIAADFYLRTGYMPLGRADAQPHRKPSPYTERQLEALVAYIASLGGPPVPKVHPERGSLSEGLRLFTESCAGCHQIVGEGGIVTGAVAPSLRNATPTQIAEAVRVGPYVMPRFPESQLSDRQLDSIVRYVLAARDPDDRGGWGIGHLGPVPEGIVAWLLAGGVLIAVIRLIGARS